MVLSNCIVGLHALRRQSSNHCPPGQRGDVPFSRSLSEDMAQTALIVEVPPSEPYVRTLREQFDPSARLGVPAHVTLLYPFMPLPLITDAVIQRLSFIAQAVEPFRFTLSKLGSFPGVIYLSPASSDQFVNLTQSIVSAFPEYPPHGGQHEGILPHLTVGYLAEVELARVKAELSAALPNSGIVASCGEFTLIENATGRWRPASRFNLGSNSRHGADQSLHRIAPADPLKFNVDGKGAGRRPKEASGNG